MSASLNIWLERVQSLPPCSKHRSDLSKRPELLSRSLSMVTGAYVLVAISLVVLVPYIKETWEVSCQLIAHTIEAPAS